MTHYYDNDNADNKLSTCQQRTREILVCAEPPNGCGLERCPQDPCVYAINVSNKELGGQCNNTLYVDDGRLAWDDDGVMGPPRHQPGR